MRITMHKEDVEFFEKVSKDPGFSRIKYTIEKREDDLYIWINFENFLN